MDILVGRTLSDQDIINKSNVIVIDANFVKDYLEVSNEKALGMDILIGDQYFTIVGVAKPHT